MDISILTIKDRLEDLRFCHFVHKPPKTEQNLQKIPGSPIDISIKYSVGLFSTSITYTPYTWSSIIQQIDLYQHLENYQVGIFTSSQSHIIFKSLNYTSDMGSWWQEYKWSDQEDLDGSVKILKQGLLVLYCSGKSPTKQPAHCWRRELSWLVVSSNIRRHFSLVLGAHCSLH